MMIVLAFGMMEYLPDGINEEDLWKIHRSKPRNPLIADICFKGGYIDAWGSGTIRIIDACQQSKMPEPLMQNNQGGFLTIIYKDNIREDYLKKIGFNKRQIVAAFYVKEEGSITNALYQHINNIGKTVATSELREMTEKGILVQAGTKGRGSKYIIGR